MCTGDPGPGPHPAIGLAATWATQACGTVPGTWAGVGVGVTLAHVIVRSCRRFGTQAVVGAVMVLSVACGGGSHSNAGRGLAVSPSTSPTSRTAPTSTVAAKKKGARRVRPKTQIGSTTTIVRHAPVAPAPLTIVAPTTTLPRALVIPAVAPGGSAPATLPTPSPTPSTPTTRPPGVTTTTVKPFDPSQQIDLSGTPGVTPAQQAAAEALVRDTLRDLPRFADQSAAYAAGYRTIGDAITGDEHWVNWAYVADTDIFDSLHPESLVYSTRVAGHPVLEAAMYMLRAG